MRGRAAGAASAASGAGELGPIVALLANPLLRPLLVISGLLLVLIAPFLLFHQHIDHWVSLWTASDAPASLSAALVVALLATDILLPIPSSVVSTFAGWELGWLGGTLASWLGMSLGASLGFALARRFGRGFAVWLSGEAKLGRTQALCDRYGAVTLAMTRGVPVLAEACVVLVGTHRLSWRRFLPVVLASNLGISLAYAAFGHYAERARWLPLALGVSIALPIVLATLLKRRG